MFASPSWGGSQGALGEHEKLLPRALIIVLCCSSKSSRQHPAPEVARSSGHMAQSARAASLDFHKSWQLRVSRSWASASRTSAVSRAARGVHPMPARDTHPECLPGDCRCDAAWWSQLPSQQPWQDQRKGSRPRGSKLGKRQG